MKYGIVGGGMLGLILANMLSRAGESVEILEEREIPGGQAASWDIGKFRASQFYHVVLSQDSSHLSLIRELGLSSMLRMVRTGTGFYIDGKIHSISSPGEFLRFPALSLAEKIRLGITILRASIAQPGRIAAVDWLQRISGQRVFERIWKPLLRAKFGAGCGQVSASYVASIIRRMFTARKKGREMFGYIEGGYGAVPEKLGTELLSRGVGIHRGIGAMAVERDRDGIRVSCKDGITRIFDRVIVTLPPPLSLNIIKGLSEREEARLESIACIGVICASMLLRKPRGSYYITNIADDSSPFTAVIEMTALVPPEELGGLSLIYLPRYATSEDQLFECPDEEIRELFIPAYLRMFPSVKPEDVECFQVARERYAIPLITPGYFEKIPPCITSLPGIYLCSSCQIADEPHTIETAIRLAEKTLAEIRGVVT